jgi:hypothetical protein
MTRNGLFSTFLLLPLHPNRENSLSSANAESFLSLKHVANETFPSFDPFAAFEPPEDPDEICANATVCFIFCTLILF